MQHFKGWRLFVLQRLSWKAINHVLSALTCFIKPSYDDCMICFSARAMMLYYSSQIILPAHRIYYSYQRAKGKKCFCHFVFLVTTKTGNIWLNSLIFVKVRIFRKNHLLNFCMVSSRFGCNYRRPKPWRQKEVWEIGSLGLQWGSRISGTKALFMLLFCHMRFPFPRSIQLLVQDGS